MNLSYRSELARPRRRGAVRAGVATALLLGAATGAQAQALYWDRNDDNAGAGSQPDGVWDSSATHWNDDSTGIRRPGTWQPNNTAVFAAGTNSTNPYTVQVDPAGITGVHGMTFQSTGGVHVTGGPIALTGAVVSLPTPGSSHHIASAVTGVDMHVQGAGGPPSSLALSGSLNLSGTLTASDRVRLTLTGDATIGTAVWVDDAFLSIDTNATVKAPALVLGSDATTGGGHLALNGGRLETGEISVGETARRPGTVVTTSFEAGEIRATRNNPQFFARFQDGELSLASGRLDIHSNGFDIGTASGFRGNGALAKIGAGTFTLGGTSTYAGATFIDQGTLRAGRANSLSPQSAHTVAAGAMLDLAGHSQTLSSLDNSGTVSLVGAAPGTTLTVANYAGGAGSTLRLGTALGDSTSATDRLVIDGGAVSGRSSLAIVNLGGLGAQTTGSGIEVIAAIHGGSTTAQTSRDAFVLAGGHVDAGAYEYTLHPAELGSQSQSWYLRSTTTAAPLTPGVVPTYRREVPLFSALPSQVRQAGQQMLGDLHKRIGDDARSIDAGHRRAWGRVMAGDSDTRQAGTVRPASEGRYSGFQAGTDLWADGNWRLGVYVGQLDSDAQVSGFASGLWGPVGRNDLRSRFFAGYGTWRNEQGWYADLVLQDGRHRISVEARPDLHWKTQASSLAASVEVGKAFALGDSAWTLEPQLQLVHQRMNVDDTLISGARVQVDGGDGWLARAGLRVKGEFATAAGSLQPYGRVNVYHADSDTTRARYIGPAATTDILTPGDATSVEAAAGVTLGVTPTLWLYGELGKLFDAGGSERQSSSVRGSAGLRVRW